MKISKLSAMRQGGAILSRIFKEAKALAAPGLSLLDIEHFFDGEIEKSGADQVLILENNLNNSQSDYLNTVQHQFYRVCPTQSLLSS